MEHDSSLPGRAAAWFRPTPAEVVGLAVLLLGASLATALWWMQADDRPTTVEAAEIGARVEPGGNHGPAPGVEPAPEAAEAMTVQVTGAVDAAGVVTLPAGSRVSDAIAALGGLDGRADVEAVNLARPLVDGEHVHVPAVGEPTVVPGTDPEPSEQQPLDVNSASAEELARLPGIGPKRASDVISHRERVGPFSVPGELRDVPGIGEKTFQRLAALITTG